jgi:hypothetical protein
VVRKASYILAILLFSFSYNICNYFYYNDEIKDISKWWGLKSNIYAVIMMLIFYASLINTKGVLKLILSIGVGFCVSNVIDKVFFNVLQFNYNDIIMIILTLCISFYQYLQNYGSPIK